MCSLCVPWQGIGKYVLRPTKLLFLRTITIHCRKSNSKSKFFPFKSYSQVLGIRSAQCHLQPHLPHPWRQNGIQFTTERHTCKAADSSHGYFFRKKSHTGSKDLLIWRCSWKRACFKIYLGKMWFCWFHLLWDCAYGLWEDGRTKSHHPLPFQFLQH